MRTFNFSQSGWAVAGTLTGSFSGTVDSAGYLDLANLTNFSVSLPTFVTVTYGLADLDLISYDTIGGASTLDFITQNHVGIG